MFGKWRKFYDFGRFLTHLHPGPLNVLQILAAAGIGAERRSWKRDGAADAILLHLANRIGQEGVPVAISPIDRDFHHLPQRRNQRPVLIVNRAPALKMVVMGSHRQKALPGDVASS